MQARHVSGISVVCVFLQEFEWPVHSFLSTGCINQQLQVHEISWEVLLFCNSAYSATKNFACLTTYVQSNGIAYAIYWNVLRSCIQNSELNMLAINLWFALLSKHHMSLSEACLLLYLFLLPSFIKGWCVSIILLLPRGFGAQPRDFDGTLALWAQVSGL